MKKLDSNITKDNWYRFSHKIVFFCKIDKKAIPILEWLLFVVHVTLKGFV